jgi:hypothetical protein
VARDVFGDSLELLARLLRRRFGRNARRAFVVLAAEAPRSGIRDQVTERLPVFRLP